MRWPNTTNFKQEVVVGRFNGTSWDLKVLAPAAGPLFDSQLAVNAAGEILVTADHYAGTGGPIDIRSAIAPSLTAPWPDLALASPAAVASKQYRESFAVSGGTAFAIGWGVHGASNQRTEVISTARA